MDKYVVVISDGEQAETISCDEFGVKKAIDLYIEDEFALVITIVKVEESEVYES